MVMVNMHEAKTNLSRLVARVANGEEIVIGRAGVPVAKLVPYDGEPRKWTFGFLKGRMDLPDDWDSDATNEAIASLFYESEIQPDQDPS